MWYEIFKFELKYRVKRPETYVFFVFLFLFSIVGTDFIFQGVELGLVKRNAPLVIAKTMGAITGIFMIIASMIMGVPVLRDFQYNTASLLFVNPVSKFDYLLGRFLGSFATLLFIFSGVLFGMMLGELMPWLSPEEMLAFNGFAYLQTFAMVTLPVLFFGAALFFVSGALSRKLIVVYTQGVIFFVLFMLTKAIKNEFLQAILDPFSLTTLTAASKGWTVAERSAQLIPFEGVFLYNKLFWMALGIIVLIVGYRKFDLSIVTDKATAKQKRHDKSTINKVAKVNYPIPNIDLKYDFKSQWIQLLKLTGFYCKSLLKTTSFWAIVICGMIIILINSVNLGTVHGVDSYPTTYFIVEELQETSVYFFIIILMFYSGELIWKERDAKLNLIYDATSVGNFTTVASKFIALIVIYIVLMLSLILSGVLFQTMNGYYHFDFKVYFFGFFVEILPFLVLYTFIAFFFQVIMNQKFIGVIMVLVFFILNICLDYLGVEHSLLIFGGNALAKYSDMNGYGHFLQPYLWIKAYWFVFGIILLGVTSVFAIRGTETSLLKRGKANMKELSHKPVFKFGILALVIFLGIGGFIFYNTNYLNAYWSSSRQLDFRANYERTLKKFEYEPQPKIVDVNLKVELFPETRDYSVEGYYVLTNTTNVVITEVHIQKLIEAQVDLDYVTFENGATESDEYKVYHFYSYMLDQPLKSGDSIRMNFKQTFTSKGFEEGNSSTSVVHNGTFLSNQDFPTIGYNQKYELDNPEDRMSYDLEPRVNKAGREDVHELLNARSGSDSDGINFEVNVGTSADQTAIAPGDLIKAWEEEGRKYFNYKMNVPMINFYSIVSARYEVKEEVWESASDGFGNAVDLAVYYHKGHEYNVDRMLNSMHKSLDYFSEQFSPYQYDQLRIMEFPRYETFAQSFPATIPFSEAIGFVLNINDEIDVDMAFYVTAHEVAHQWWGMQVEAANVQGQLMILETLAQYSALMVLKANYPEEKVQQFLTLQLEKYNTDRVRATAPEPPLALVENQKYIYYNKGASAMYALQEAIGEENVNLALRSFISDWTSANGQLKKETKRYATTQDLLDYFREVTPSSKQHIISDLFETVEDQ
jgi:hypothetical protein